MIKKILTLITLLTFGVVGSAIIVNSNTSAVNPFEHACKGSSSVICNNKGEKVETGIQGVINILLWAVGIISVIAIILSGIMYIVSTGDPGKVTKAKNALLYAVIGLVVSLMAYAIVNYVVSKF